MPCISAALCLQGTNGKPPSHLTRRATWRSPGRLFGQKQPVRPLLLCFAGPQAADSATEARPLLGKRTATSQSGSDAGRPTTVEVPT
jgi:hypothetical protein